MTRLIDLPLDLLLHITECIPDARSRHSFYTAFPQAHHSTVAACISSSLSVTPMGFAGHGGFLASTRLQDFPPPCKLEKLIIKDDEPCKYNAWRASMVSLFLPETPRASAALSTLKELHLEGLNPPQALTQDDQQVIASAISASCPQLTRLCLPDTESYSWLLEQLAVCTKGGTLGPLRLTCLHLHATQGNESEDGLSNSAIAAFPSLQDLTISSQSTRNLEGLSRLRGLKRVELDQGYNQNLEGLNEMLEACSQLETLILSSLYSRNFPFMSSDKILHLVSSSLRVLRLNVIYWEDDYDVLAQIITSLPNCQKISTCRLFVSCHALECVTFSEFCMQDDGMPSIVSAAKLLASKLWECEAIEFECFGVDEFNGYLDGILPLVRDVGLFEVYYLDLRSLVLPSELVCKLGSIRHLILKNCNMEDEMTFERFFQLLARLPQLRKLEVHQPRFDQYERKLPVLPCVAPSAVVSHSVQDLHLSGFTVVRGFLTSIACIFPCVQSIRLSKCETLGYAGVAPCPAVEIDLYRFTRDSELVQQSHACIEGEAWFAFPLLNSFSLYSSKNSSSSG